MYERRLERSLNKTMDELHKRKLIRQLEQANKAVEDEEFGMDEHLQNHPQVSLVAATQLTQDRGQTTEDGRQMTEDRKNEKQTQFDGTETESRSQRTEKNINQC